MFEFNHYYQFGCGRFVPFFEGALLHVEILCNIQADTEVISVFQRNFRYTNKNSMLKNLCVYSSLASVLYLCHM